VSLVSTDDCCGCGVCSNVCPHNAVELVEQYADYKYPRVDSLTRCTHCGLCYDICPAVNPQYRTDRYPESYIVKASDEIREISSSGGVFGVLSKYALSKGALIAGVVWSEKSAKYVLTDDPAIMKKMHGSKYVAANTGTIYSDVKQHLDGGREVIFTGCPCHIAALNNFLKHDFPNLTTVDIVCHGCLPEGMLKAFLNETGLGEDLQSIDFRNKERFGWSSNGTVYNLKNGTTVSRQSNEYYKIFSSDIAARNSCIHCKFSKAPRQADLSMGDYWNAKYTPCALDDGKGLSLLLLNTKKGELLFKKLINDFQKEKTTYDTAMLWNRKGSLPIPITRDRFLNIYDSTKSVLKAFDYATNWKYDVGIFGPTNNPNYGGLLTYYALYKVICGMGYSCLLINNPIINNESTIDTHSRKFFKKHTDISVQRPVNRQTELNDHVDAFILGSDQVWNYNLFATWGDMLYLDFVNDAKKMISYASSFGLDRLTIPDAKITNITALLQRFDFISVREKDGQSILKEHFNIHGDIVLDPVFLMDLQDYSLLEKESEIDTDCRYIGSYLVDPNELKISILKDVSSQLKIKFINMTDGNPSVFKMRKPKLESAGFPVLDDVTIYDFINVIKNSEFFVTDSYHAACLCIMFKIKFIVIQPSWATSRLETLLNCFDLRNRWINNQDFNSYKFDDNWLLPIDYVKIDKIWADKKRESMNWLKQAIDSSKRTNHIDCTPKKTTPKSIESMFNKNRNAVCINNDTSLFKVKKNGKRAALSKKIKDSIFLLDEDHFFLVTSSSLNYYSFTPCAKKIWTLPRGENICVLLDEDLNISNVFYSE